MTSYAFRIAVTMLIAVCCAMFVPRVEAADPVLSIEDFLAIEKTKWKRFAESKVLLRVEGRHSSNSEKSVRFQNCNLPFRTRSGKTLPRFTTDGANLEVTGHLKRESTKFVFIIEEVNETDSDHITFVKRRNELRDAPAAAWYGLADWAHRRAEFYDDDDLADDAQDAARRGIMIERAQPKNRKNVDGLLALAVKVKRLGLPNSLRQELIHESFRIKWDALRKKKKRPDVTPLVEQLAASYPECVRRLPAPLPDLEKQYREAPIKVYLDSGSRRRKSLHRIFYYEVVLLSIEQQAENDGKNGYEIADKIEKQVPEHHGLADEYRDRELAYKSSQIDTCSQREAVVLAHQYRDRGRKREARKTLEDWLEAKRGQTEVDDTAGLRRLAELYEDWLEDKPAAVALLMEAHQAAPISQDIIADLRRHGYSFVDGQWMTTTKAKQRPVGPLKRAMQAGLVSEGMTALQVRQSLGSPSSITRVATAGHVNEIWVYREREVVRITVHLVRRSNRPGLDATVVRTR